MILREIIKFLSSAKLAMVLLIVILSLCFLGVTVLRGPQAGLLIFNTLWFNFILVLLVINVCFCFFPRMWGRKLTIVSFGMIIFHLSFVAILGGVIYNSLYFFRGDIRLTEGETLPNNQLESYDTTVRGSLFDLSKLKGETTLVRMHTGYRVKGDDKRAAYEIEVGERGIKKHEIIYITHGLTYKGFRYFCDREGYSVLTILYDRMGNELYGAHIPLQSLRQKDDSIFYTTGSRNEPASLPFPQKPLEALFDLQVAYHPSKLTERGGEATFRLWPLAKADAKEREAADPHSGAAKSDGTDPHASLPDGRKEMPDPHAGLPKAGTPQPAQDIQKQTDNRMSEKPLAEGKVPVGQKFNAGDYQLEAREIRYWVIMNVSYEPGLPIVLASLWTALGGLIITFIGRLLRGKQVS